MIAIALVLVLPSLFVPLVVDEHLLASRWRDTRGGLVGFLGDCFVFATGPRATSEWSASAHGIPMPRGTRILSTSFGATTWPSSRGRRRQWARR